MTTEKTVLISGTGVAGLAAAWYLTGIGWKAIVVEKAHELRSGGYMLSLSGPGYKVAERIGVLDELEQSHVNLGTSVFRNKKGKKLWQINYQRALQDLEWITLSRSRLVKILYKKVSDKTEIHFGLYPQAIQSSPDQVCVTLSDGTVLEVDLFIGADGLRSSARELVFGDRDVYMHSTGYRCAAFQFPNNLDMGENAVNYGEPGRITEFYPMSKDRLASLYLWNESMQQQTGEAQIPRDQIKQRLLAAYQNANPNVLKAIEELPADEEIYCDSVHMVKMPRWYRGRCLLLGDAAHCLTLASGQGASMAMTSASMLADALRTNSDINKALAHHDRRLRPLITAIQRRTEKIIKGYVPLTPFSFWLRNWIFRMLPERWIGLYVAKSVRKEAIRMAKALE